MQKEFELLFFFNRISEKLNLIFKDYAQNKCWSHREISLRTFETSFPRRQNMSCPKSFWGQNPPRNQRKLTENFEVTSYIKRFENESYFRLSRMEKLCSERKIFVLKPWAQTFWFLSLVNEISTKFLKRIQNKILLMQDVFELPLLKRIWEKLKVTF